MFTRGFFEFPNVDFSSSNLLKLFCGQKLHSKLFQSSRMYLDCFLWCPIACVHVCVCVVYMCACERVYMCTRVCFRVIYLFQKQRVFHFEFQLSISLVIFLSDCLVSF